MKSCELSRVRCNTLIPLFLLLTLFISSTSSSQEVVKSDTQTRELSSGKEMHTRFYRNDKLILAETILMDGTKVDSTTYQFYNSSEELSFTRKIERTGMVTTEYHNAEKNSVRAYDFQSDGFIDLFLVRVNEIDDEYFLVQSRRHIRPIPGNLYVRAKEVGTFDLVYELICDYLNQIR